VDGGELELELNSRPNQLFGLLLLIDYLRGSRVIERELTAQIPTPITLILFLHAWKPGNKRRHPTDQDTKADHRN